MEILIVGDVFSKLGRETFGKNLKRIKEKRNINFVIVNGENTTHGRGLNLGHYKWYMENKVNVITLGNHSYQNKSILTYINEVNNVVRPLNFPDNAPGKGYVTINYNGKKITVFQLIGTIFMNGELMKVGEISSPFVKAEELLNSVESDIYICDFHAEATSEKIAFGHYFTGKIDVIFGTHTHVQTSDARIINNETAYITDVGMTGALDGVIGVKKDIIIDRLVNKKNQVFSPEDKGLSQFSAIIVEIDDKTNQVKKIETIFIVE